MLYTKFLQNQFLPILKRYFADFENLALDYLAVSRIHAVTV